MIAAAIACVGFIAGFLLRATGSEAELDKVVADARRFMNVEHDKYVAALEMLDECRAALSIEVEDANRGNNFAARCDEMCALSQQVDDFLESVNYGSMPRLNTTHDEHEAAFIG